MVSQTKLFKTIWIFGLLFSFVTCMPGNPKGRTYSKKRGGLKPVRGHWGIERDPGGKVRFPAELDVELHVDGRKSRRLKLKRGAEKSVDVLKQKFKAFGKNENFAAFRDPRGGLSVVCREKQQDTQSVCDMVGVVVLDSKECVLISGQVICPDGDSDILDFANDIAVAHKNQGENRHGNSKRRRRQAQPSGNYHVEICVAVDFSWYDWFDYVVPVGTGHTVLESAQLLLTALVNEVDLYYKDIGTGFNLEIVLRDWIIATDYTESSQWSVNNGGKVDASDAFRRLPSYVQNRLDVSKCDMVIGLTRLNVTIEGKDILGVVMGIPCTCDPEGKYSVVEDGTRTSIVLAHEIGHCLWAYHDVGHEGIISDPGCIYGQYVMSTPLSAPAQSTFHSFSSCSKKSIAYFLTSQSGSCLSVSSFSETDLSNQRCEGYTGTHLSIHNQCIQKYLIYSVIMEGTCTGYIPPNPDDLCSRQLNLCLYGNGCYPILVADGTECDAGKVCIGGRCVVNSKDCATQSPTTKVPTTSTKTSTSTPVPTTSTTKFTTKAASSTTTASTTTTVAQTTNKATTTTKAPTTTLAPTTKATTTTKAPTTTLAPTTFTTKAPTTTTKAPTTYSNCPDPFACCRYRSYKKRRRCCMQLANGCTCYSC